MPDDNWPPAWTRAALEMCVLAVIARAGTTHGYEIVRALQLTGLGEIKGGTLYPVIARLEEQGLISAHWVDGDGGPGRKLVTVTDRGRAERVRRRDQWRTWTAKVAAVIERTDDSTTGSCLQMTITAARRNRQEQHSEPPANRHQPDHHALHHPAGL